MKTGGMVFCDRASRWRLYGYAVIAAGIFLRLYGLAFQGYWFDEVMTLRHVTEGRFLALLRQGYFGDPPLYESLLYVWTKCLGTHEAQVRLLSSLFSIASLPVFLLLARRIFGAAAAVFATALLAFSSYHIYYAQEARMYALFGFLALLSNLLFVVSLQDQQGARHAWLGYALVTALAFYAHYAFAAVVLAQAITVMLARRASAAAAARFGQSLCIAGLLVLPWLLASVIPRFIVPVFITKTAYSWVEPPSLQTLWKTFLYFAAGQEQVIRGLGGRYVIFASAVLCLALACAGMACARGLSKKNERPLLVFVLLWCVVPVACIYAVSVFIRPIYQVRYVDTALFAGCLALGCALSRLSRRWLGMLLLAVFLAPGAISLHRYYTAPVKSVMRECAFYLSSAAGATQRIYVSNGYEKAVLQYYLGPGLAPRTDDLDCTRLAGAIRGGGDFWMVVSASDRERLAGCADAPGMLNRQYDEIAKKEFGAVSVICARPRSPGVPGAQF